MSTVLHIGPVAAPDTDLRVDDGAGAVILTRHDQMTPVAALAVARRLAGYRPGSDPAGGSRGWLARVGVGDPAHIDPEMLWDNQFSAPLRVPIGTSEDGGTVDLDIREAAADGMGPHGLCLGATGSGKSELLRTIALGMIARHSPENAQPGAGRLQGRGHLPGPRPHPPHHGRHHQPRRRGGPRRPYA